jgi:WD40 repeat protein
MSDTRATASVTERTRGIDAGAPVAGVHFIGGDAVFVLGEEILFARTDDATQRVGVDAAIVSSASDGRRIVIGTDDGRVVAVAGDGVTTAIATDAKWRWIDHVALAPDAVAWSAGKEAFVKSGKAEPRALDLPSSAGGLAFAPKGLRLAIAHYQGVSLWFPNADAAPEKLEWKGSHLGVGFHPEGKFLVTAMQEPMLHGWRLADRKDMRMSGYAAKVRSLAWSAGGKWLATSGADQVILWSFEGKDGPMGKEPRMLAPAPALVTAVACHPTQDVVAAGYANGMVLLVRVADGADIVGKRPGVAPVTALAWNSGGTTLAWGTEGGEAGVVDLG